MLFNSYVFLFAFLPLTFGLFHFLRLKVDFRAAIFALISASLVFYAWWSPKFLPLLLGLIVFSYATGQAMIRMRRVGRLATSKSLLIFGIIVNLGALAYFKYANFLADNFDDHLGTHFNLAAIVLPIGISFIAFQKIAFLVDVYEGKVEDIKFLDYALFVTFFPQLIAGPITHHSELIPQFTRERLTAAINPDQLQRGFTFFVFGLSKKVLLADSVASYVGPYFHAAAEGKALDGVAAWTAALAYTAQLYFDFSAYSDMAIGIGLLFGIKLPINFNSPYKSANIIEFWRRWHMTLSRFLRDYLYIALGGNRKGKVRRYINLLLTMVLGGIWHGAGWTFLVWGILHGTYLMINHGWNAMLGEKKPASQGYRIFSWAITFLGVIVGWVFFRAANIESAIHILKAMTGANGWKSPQSWAGLTTTIVLLAGTYFAPNSQEITGYVGPESTNKVYEFEGSKRGGWFAWRPSLGWAVWAGVLFAFCLTMFSQVSEFIYFQF